MHNAQLTIAANVFSSDPTNEYALGTNFGSTNANSVNTTTIPQQQAFIGRGTSNFGWKVSALNFISNLFFQTDNSYTITNETNMQIINMIRLLIEHDWDWVEQEGSVSYYFYLIVLVPNMTIVADV